MSDHTQAPNPIGWAYGLGSMTCNVALVIWGVLTLLKPAGPGAEELVVIYWWVVPLIAVLPAGLALYSWLNRWYLTKRQLFAFNAPFAIAVALWAWVASLLT